MLQMTVLRKVIPRRPKRKKSMARKTEDRGDERTPDEPIRAPYEDRILPEIKFQCIGLHPGLHLPRNGSLERGALASGAMITTTIQRGAGLTPRQREVVALIAAGCSNDEVGERLGISPRTAKAHSDTLRSKLGVSRRRQIPVAFRVLTGEDPLSASLGALVRRPGV